MITIPPPSPAVLNHAFSTVRADVAASAKLPDGRTVFIYGDTMKAGRQVFCSPSSCPYGYPHDSFAWWSGGKLTPVAGPYGYGVQQIPNARDGAYYWPTGVVADGSRLDVLAARVVTTVSDPASRVLDDPAVTYGFRITGSAVAVFSSRTLKWQRTVALPGKAPVVLWSSAVRMVHGWWLAGSDGTLPKEGDMAWVPDGQLLNPSGWRVTLGAIPATFSPGTTVALSDDDGQWQAWTKQSDIYGTQIAGLTAPGPLGPWTQTTSLTPWSPAGTQTYAVYLHPSAAAPAGETLLSYSVAGSYAAGHPLFVYVTP